MGNQLTIDEILSNAFKIGLKNFLSIWAIYILWILTIWIPYVNVGTTIAVASLPIMLNDESMISPVEIFESKYRKFMGGFFIIVGITILAFILSVIFLFIPYWVLMISWCMGICLMVDKDINPIEALMESNNRTYGHKWTIFFSFFVLYLPLIILCLIRFLFPSTDLFFGIIIFLYFLFLPPIVLGAQTHIYKTLAD
jgi:hypothetical protein